MQSRIEEIRALEAEVLAISVDSVEANRKLAAKQRFDFQLLSDLEGEAIEAFGLRHANANPMGDQDIARPATIPMRASTIRISTKVKPRGLLRAKDRLIREFFWFIMAESLNFSSGLGKH